MRTKTKFHLLNLLNLKKSERIQTILARTGNNLMIRSEKHLLKKSTKRSEKMTKENPKKTKKKISIDTSSDKLSDA